MRFNSVKSGNFTSAAKAVNRSADQMFQASRESAPDFTGISKTAIAARTKERNASTDAQNLRDVTQIKADTLVEGTQLEVDTEKAVNDIKRPAKRMAGVVAGLGALSTGAINIKEAKEAKAERATLKLERDKITQMNKDFQAQSVKDREMIMEMYKSGRKTDAPSTTPSTSTSTPTSTPTSTNTSTSQPLSSGGKGWTPFGSTLKFAEGTFRKGDKSYNTGYGYNMFDDLSKHPDKVFNNTSAAAGAYQFMPKTWSRVSNHLGLTDFSPQSQEAAGEQLAKWRGVDTGKTYTTRAELTQALHSVAPEWASVPDASGKSYYDGDGINSAKPMDDLISFYESQVGYKLK
jgi:muramidase (phage lysozyme)